MPKIQISYNGHPLSISYFERKAQRTPIVFLHGLGCSKEDYINALEQPQLSDFSLVAFDFPGCGLSDYPDGMNVEINDLLEITKIILDKLGLTIIHLVAHSMGGLVGLLFAEKYYSYIISFSNVEGNLAASDCFFSRKIAQKKRKSFVDKIFSRYLHKIKTNPNIGLQAHAKIMEKFTNPFAMYDVCKSLVDYSDNGDLLKRFENLPMPIQFIYGSENKHLPYLAKLKASKCAVNAIGSSNHFPCYDNPAEFYKALQQFINSNYLK